MLVIRFLDTDNFVKLFKRGEQIDFTRINDWIPDLEALYPGIYCKEGEVPTRKPEEEPQQLREGYTRG